jgi:hypothetical protein
LGGKPKGADELWAVHKQAECARPREGCRQAAKGNANHSAVEQPRADDDPQHLITWGDMDRKARERAAAVEDAKQQLARAQAL